MTLTFNTDYYKELLSQYQPKIIRTEEENDKALAIVAELMHLVNTPEVDELYELLIVLIEKFEQEYYSFKSASTPHSMLTFLIEQRGIKEADLIEIIGSLDVASEVVNGKREITISMAKALGEFFHVDAGLFL